MLHEFEVVCKAGHAEKHIILQPCICQMLLNSGEREWRSRWICHILLVQKIIDGAQCVKAWPSSGFCCQRCPVATSFAAAYKVMLPVYENSLCLCICPWAFQLIRLKRSVLPWTQTKCEGPVQWEMLPFWHFFVFWNGIEIGKYWHLQQKSQEVSIRKYYSALFSWLYLCSDFFFFLHSHSWNIFICSQWTRRADL